MVGDFEFFVSDVISEIGPELPIGNVWLLSVVKLSRIARYEAFSI
jgi:hypothetical protein